MRAILLLLVSSALLVGCRSPGPPQPDAMAGEPAKRPAANKPVRPDAARDSSPQSARATPIMEPAGKVASVNEALRFVVIDFAFNPAPQVDQKMGVYRQGQKVGEVKISNQARNNIMAADVTAGEARIGDEVRPD